MMHKKRVNQFMIIFRVAIKLLLFFGETCHKLAQARPCNTMQLRVVTWWPINHVGVDFTQ